MQVGKALCKRIWLFVTRAARQFTARGRSQFSVGKAAISAFSTPEIAGWSRYCLTESFGDRNRLFGGYLFEGLPGDCIKHRSCCPRLPLVREPTLRFLPRSWSMVAVEPSDFARFPLVSSSLADHRWQFAGVVVENLAVP